MEDPAAVRERARSVLRYGVTWSALTLLVTACGQEPPPPPATAPGSGPSNGSAAAALPPARVPHYVGSAECARCHEAEHESWRASHHALAERPLDPALDAEAFRQERVVEQGAVTSVALTTDEGPALELETADGERRRFLAERVFGVSPLRQVLIDPDPPGTDSGRLQASQIAWDPAKAEWFDVFGDEHRVPGEWGSWTGRGMNWNAMCADCHNTAVDKGYDPARDAYETTMAEMGVGCESCHGPGSDHVSWQGGHAGESPDPTIASLRAPADPALSVDACGVCHARREALMEHLPRGAALLEAFHPELPSASPTFLPDGRIRDEDFEYASFLLSRLHLGGVTCLDCHEPHSGSLRLPGDDLCMSCHNAPVGALQAPIDRRTHSRHAPDQASCVDCHMPRTTYMQRHPRHDHSFSVPDPALSLELGLRNACTDCHEARDARWALTSLEGWLGEGRSAPRRERARITARVRDGELDVLADLIEWSRREEHPAWRAVTANLLAEFVAVDLRAGARLTELMRDSSALVRSCAARACDPATANVEPALRKLLTDEVRAVRVLAARSLRGLDVSPTSRAGRDLAEYVAVGADQPTGLLLASSIAAENGETERALGLLERAADWDPHSLDLWRSRSHLLAQLGRDDEALALARSATTRFPDLAPAWFDLGLALGADRAGLPEAAAAFERSVALDPRFARAWYNLGLARAGLDELEGAIFALERAVAEAPGDPELLYGLATVCRDGGRTERARQCARTLLELAPQAQQVRALATQLGLDTGPR